MFSWYGTSWTKEEEKIYPMIYILYFITEKDGIMIFSAQIKIAK